MSGEPIQDGVVVVTDGKISAVGKAGDVAIPEGYRVLRAKVVTPGLIDARSVVGLGGIYNSQKHDQDQLERSEPTQPELRAIDAYNARERLVRWVRELGTTTVHTGHAPGELISGQTCIVKTTGNSIEAAAVRPVAMVAATLAESAKKSGAAKPGTRAKMMSLLRQELISAREYLRASRSTRTPEHERPAIATCARRRSCRFWRAKLPLLDDRTEGAGHPQCAYGSPRISASGSCSTARPRPIS